MGKLWQKGYTLDTLMETFTVGNDYLIDLDLVRADCLGSIAHARTLRKSGLLNEQELSDLERGLREILDLHAAGSFTISVSDEDCHTAIEAYLTSHIEIGRASCRE